MQVDQEMVFVLCALTTLGCALFALCMMCLTFSRIIRGVMNQKTKKQ